ncbi:caspase family protein [Gordonia aquimaris]|uniref:Caspase family protein n=1 Tax=Gordonia aquimaris TaxID=2984863 RepID=A0A9X3I6I1_9ACTN|nr:caspase family protein [Gordonia aquimaris]MCX2966852.1 caspase family protein [Gordonia aquimaris]
MTSKRRALVVGIERAFDSGRLPSAPSDARAMARVLAHDDTHDGPVENWQVTSLIEENGRGVLDHQIQAAVTELLVGAEVDDNTELLFYYSGHGRAQPWGGEFVAYNNVAMSFNDLMVLVNTSKAESITLILDCCFSGGVGNEDGHIPDWAEVGSDPFRPDRAVIREGLAILTAARKYEPALEVERAGERPVGAFTELLIGGLEGGAADVLGYITSLDLYAYAAQGFTDSTQRPTFKAHVDKARPIRRVKAPLRREQLVKIVQIFDEGHAKKLTAEHDYVPGCAGAKPRTGEGVVYEPFSGSPAQCELDAIKLFRNGGLVATTTPDQDLWDCCHNGDTVELTGIGKYYWSLVNRGLLPPE